MSARPALLGAGLMIAAACSAGSSEVGPTVTSSVVPTVSPSVVPTIAASTAVASSRPVPPTSRPVTSSTSPSTIPAPAAPACTATWTIRAKVAQLVMPGVRGEDLAAVIPTLGGEGVGGVLVTTWPETATAEALAALLHAGAVPMLAAVDEEGGDVQRLRRIGLLPSAAEVAATMTPAEAEVLVAAHATEVAAIGFDVVFAPVVDITPPDGDSPIGDRSFGTDPSVVAAYAGAYVRAWQAAGVLPVLKHFPGHGRANADSHDGTALSPALADLRRIDLVPYAELLGTGAGVMVGHLDVPGLTEPGVPASLSPSAITGLLRDEIGYTDALVVTDALGMGAITGRHPVPVAAVLAIVAGADLALVSSVRDVTATIDALESAVLDGRLDEPRLSAALSHVLTAKGFVCPA